MLLSGRVEQISMTCMPNTLSQTENLIIRTLCVSSCLALCLSITMLRLWGSCFGPAPASISSVQEHGLQEQSQRNADPASHLLRPRPCTPAAIPWALPARMTHRHPQAEPWCCRQAASQQVSTPSQDTNVGEAPTS